MNLLHILVYMRLFYIEFPISEKPSHLLSWSHYVELLKLSDKHATFKNVTQVFDLKTLRFFNRLNLSIATYKTCVELVETLSIETYKTCVELVEILLIENTK